MDYIQITIEGIDQDATERLIALLENIGFEGFEEEERVLKAFIPANVFDEILINNLFKENYLTYSKSIIKEINWNEKWESGFEPVSVYSADNRLFAFLRADFHAPNPLAMFDLVITPKMSFGTGHHATTYLMIREMAELDFSQKNVIDFGTGTGVLAILADKLGAKEVIGIDYDDWSISNAGENIKSNQCTKIRLLKADKCIATDQKSDFILANINLNIIKDNLQSIKESLIPNGIVLFSGILKTDLNDIETAIRLIGLNIQNVSEKDNWLLIKAAN